MLVFAVASAAAVWGVWRGPLEATEISDNPTKLELGLMLEERMADLAEGRRRIEIVFLGDSTVVSYPHKKRVFDELQHELDRRMPRRFKVLPFAYPGMASFEYYTLTPALVSAGAGHVVIPVNLASFGGAWGTLFRRPELAGWMPWSALPELMRLPLRHVEATFDHILVSMLLVHGGLAEEWNAFGRVQMRGHAQLEDLRIALGQKVSKSDGMPRRPRFRNRLTRDRANAKGVRNVYGAAIDGVGPDDPVLRILAAGLARFREAGIPVLVYAVPTNVEHFENVGEMDAEGLARTIASIREVVESEGQAFVDLHDLLPDAGFRDIGGHFTHEKGEIQGPHLVAERLADAILDDMRARSRAEQRAGRAEAGEAERAH